ncbi:MAG: Penicillin-binding protein [Pseudomonadota bacterium]|jgi:monofunctional biosynthetic peptidoglycan transglycosylase
MQHVKRTLIWLLLAALALQIFFVLHVALLLVVDPHSTAFMRSEAWRIATASLSTDKRWRWSHQWLDYPQISPHLKRAVLASEDAGFVTHGGVDWDAIESAWQKNQKQQQLAQKRAEQQEKQRAKQAEGTAPPPKPVKPAKVVGGSTISQQLAKNLLLSGERHLLRKAQELLLTLTLEVLLSKPRILEIYLNSVEWGEGVFGAEAAAQRYFNKPASQLNPSEAARLAVMLPSPKFFENRQNSAYLAQRTATIVARMGAVSPP